MAMRIKARMKTFFDPVRMAVRTASIATLPPPITATRSPSETFSPRLILLR